MQCQCAMYAKFPDSKVHGAYMGPIWGQQDPGGHHVGPLKFAIWDCFRAFRPTNAVYGLQVGVVKAAIVIINTFLLETMKAFILGSDEIYPNFNDFPSLGFDIYSRARLSFIANTITADNPVKPRNQGINIHGIELLAPIIVRRAGLLLSQQDFEWRWSVPLFQCLTVLEFSFILFDLCLLITFFNFIMNYVPIVTFWIFTYHKIWILSIMFCFIWSYWIIYFLACL